MNPVSIGLIVLFLGISFLILLNRKFLYFISNDTNAEIQFDVSKNEINSENNIISTCQNIKKKDME